MSTSCAHSSDVVFTASVDPVQIRKDERGNSARVEEPVRRTRMASDLADFIEAQTSFFLATVNADGQPCIEQCGGPTGFLSVRDDGTLGFPDFACDRGCVAQADPAIDPGAHIFLIDYARRRCVTIRGKARVVENDPELAANLARRSERTILFSISALDADGPFARCPKAVDGGRAIEPRKARRDARKQLRLPGFSAPSQT